MGESAHICFCYRRRDPISQQLFWTKSFHRRMIIKPLLIDVQDMTRVVILERDIPWIKRSPNLYMASGIKDVKDG